MNPWMRRALIGAVSITGVLAVRRFARARKRIDFAGRVVLITGGSRGLGLVLARQFAAQGARLALVARDEAELERAAQELREGGAEVLTVAADIGRLHPARDVVRQVVEHFGRLDVLVNNAGLIEVGPVETMRLEDFRQAMRVHAWGPLYLMRAALRPMRRQGGGRIVNIVSIGGKVAIPHLAPYTTSKFALAGLSDAMRAELARHQIYVTTVFPGLMRTGSHVQARFRGRPEREYTWFAAGAGFPLTSTAAESAARAIVEACRYGVPQRVITPQAKLLVLAQAVAPDLTAAVLALVNRVLPAPAPLGLSEDRTGWDSRGGRILPILTAPADRAIPRNNQARQG